MIASVEGFLRAQGVAASAVSVERFVAQGRSRQTRATGVTHAVRFARSGVLLQVPDDQTLLDAARRAGLDLPFSCAMGGCGACKVKRIEGEVELEAPNCLSASEEAGGDCLTCVGRPRSAVTLDI
jgi:ring-1,2-phenylacetyl-CoA epoxidase subunit PaaE